MTIITVQSGDTVASIARAYGSSVERIMTDNGVPPSGALAVGQSIVIQTPAVVHTVNPGETVYYLSSLYNISPNTIYRNNYGLGGQPNLTPGQEIVISYEREPIGTFAVGGYAYPFISDELMNTVLPYMTYFMPFTYGFKTDGTLVPLDDTRMINAAFEYSAAPFMHLSTLTEYGNFSSDLAHTLLNSEELQNTLIENILLNIEQKNYQGLDVDFEYLPREDREKYVNFISKATAVLNQSNHQVFVALPPKTADEQPGLLYEGIDYQGMGLASNACFLMTYEWGYTYGPPMAISPLPAVRRVLDYAVTRIPRDKLIMGISNYGYDWTLPFVQGESKAPSLSTEEAIGLALQYGAVIQYDEDSQAPYFYYTDREGREHVVWFEDARSIQAKLLLLPEYQLKGAFYWDLMRRNPQNYVVLNSLVDIIKDA